MKVYKGARLYNDSIRVTVNGKCLRHYVKHSPSGYEWGYMGSGPADLARSILIDHFDGDIVLADKSYQRFKDCYVAGWKDTWHITSDEIDSWLEGGC